MSGQAKGRKRWLISRVCNLLWLRILLSIAKKNRFAEAENLGILRRARRSYHINFLHPHSRTGAGRLEVRPRVMLVS